MGSFLKNAQEIFEVARQSGEPEDLTIHLNNTTFRVTRAQGRVSVEGSSEGQRCVLQTAAPQRLLLPDQPRYVIGT